MDPNKLDKLFQEKLYGYEIQPKSDTWSEIERQVGSRRTPPKIYWVAASVGLLALGFLTVWRSYLVPDQQFITNIDYPQKSSVSSMQIPSHPATKSNVASKSHRSIEPKKLAANSSDHHDTYLEQLELKRLGSIGMASTGEMKLIDLQKSDRVPAIVKITYIASEKPNPNEAEKEFQEIETAKGLKKFFRASGSLSPGDVLADIRSAKDDFISNGFKSKEKEKPSL